MLLFVFVSSIFVNNIIFNNVLDTIAIEQVEDSPELSDDKLDADESYFVINEVISISTFFESFISTNTYYKTSYLSFSIWQPPKLK